MTYMRGRPSVWVLTGIILLAQGFFSRPAFAQGEPQPQPAQETLAQTQVLRNPEVNYPVHSDISPPLILMAPVVSPQQGPHVAPEVRYPKLQLLTTLRSVAWDPWRTARSRCPAARWLVLPLAWTCWGLGTASPAM